MNENILTIARADDWEGIYVGGKLHDEGHSIELKRGIEIAIENNVTKVVWQEVDDDWISEVGNLPSDMNEVKWAK
jgi:hypothetical protein